MDTIVCARFFISQVLLAASQLYLCNKLAQFEIRRRAKNRCLELDSSGPLLKLMLEKGHLRSLQDMLPFALSSCCGSFVICECGSCYMTCIWLRTLGDLLPPLETTSQLQSLHPSGTSGSGGVLIKGPLGISLVFASLGLGWSKISLFRLVSHMALWEPDWE